jgi:hypothetical protein
MKLRKNRVVERIAVNSVRTLFEASGCVFQEVDQGNDYGKDAYVDLVDSDKVTGHCIAVQIKGGNKYRRANGYVIPIDNHEDVWRQCPLPVAGIVFDDETDTLYWCDITTFLDDHVGEKLALIPVSQDNILNATMLERRFKPLFRKLAKRSSLGQAILNLASSTSRQRIVALMDCFGSGRSDPRVFLLMRNLLMSLEREEFRRAVWLLSHAADHPDILWTKHNWVPHEVEVEVKKAFRWKEYEIIRLLTDVSWEEWQRGALGQCVYALLVEDPEIKEKMECVAVEAMRSGNEDLAWAAFYLTIYWARRKALAKYQQLLAEEPTFRNLELMGELQMILAEYPFVTLFE